MKQWLRVAATPVTAPEFPEDRPDETSRSPMELEMVETAEILSQTRIHFEEQKRKLNQSMADFKAAQELILGIPELQKTVKSEEPQLIKLLQKLTDFTVKIGKWIVKLSYTPVKSSPSYQKAFETLRERVALIDPDLERVSMETMKYYQDLADDAAAARLGETITVEEEKEPKPKKEPKKKSSLWLVSAKEETGKKALKGLSGLSKTISEMEDKFQDIEEIMIALYE